VPGRVQRLLHHPGRHGPPFQAADTIGRLTSKLQTYLRPNVLVIEDVGYQPLERTEANLVFQVVSKRYEKGSTLLTSNKSFG
jgi:DNA replication protein DnaC